MEKVNIHNVESAAEALMQLIEESNKYEGTEDGTIFADFLNKGASILWYLIERLAFSNIVAEDKVPNFYRVMLMHLLHQKYEHLILGGLTQQQVNFEKNLDLIYISGKMEGLLRKKEETEKLDS